MCRRLKLIEGCGGSPPRETRPLCGVRVLDATEGAISSAARLLVELGADVIRLEASSGSPDRAQGHIVGNVSVEFVAANLGKRAASCEQLQDLARDADILFFRRGAVETTNLNAANPRLVTISISEFGDTGEYSKWKATDAELHAMSGELSRSGLPDRAPLLPPGNIATNCAAAQAAFVALVAYWQALITDRGLHLDFSMLDGVSQALDPGYGISGSAAGGVLANKLPRDRADVRFMYPILACRDGVIRLCVLNPKHWHGMFEWMGRPEEFADPSFDKIHVRFASRPLLDAIAKHLMTLTCAEAEIQAAEFGVPAAIVVSLSEALANEHFSARQVVTPIEIAPGITVPFANGIIEIDGRRMTPLGGPPDIPSEPLDWKPRKTRARPELQGDRPLAGLRVLDFGIIVVGAETGRLLADQGAEVIKVESSQFLDGSRQSRHPGPISPAFATGHRNKRSLGVNLRTPKGRQIVHDLVRECDVVLSNFKGGTLEALGLDYRTLKQINPRIILVDSSAYGSFGPWSKRMGYGPLVRASAGLTAQWRYPDEPNGYADGMTIYPDHVAARIGAIGVLALLIRRLTSGEGGQIEISQAEVMINHIGTSAAIETLRKAGHEIALDQCRTEVLACAGTDEWCVVTTCGADDAERIADVTGSNNLRDWIATKTPGEAAEVLQSAGLAAAPIPPARTGRMSPALCENPPSKASGTVHRRHWVTRLLKPRGGVPRSRRSWISIRLKLNSSG